MKTKDRKDKIELVLKDGSAIRLRDGRTARVESVSQHGMLWIRDSRGNLSSAAPKLAGLEMVTGQTTYRRTVELSEVGPLTSELKPKCEPALR